MRFGNSLQMPKASYKGDSDRLLSAAEGDGTRHSNSLKLSLIAAKEI